MAGKSLKFLMNKGFSFEGDRWEKTQTGSYRLKSPDKATDTLYTYGQCNVKEQEPTSNANDQPPKKLTISGMANAAVVDRMDEIVEPRGLDHFDFMKNPILLLNHNYSLPIGQVTHLDVQEDGVHFDAWVGDESKAELTQWQKDTISLVKQGILKTVSIGFIPLEIQRPTYNDKGERLEPLKILKWLLLELSIVSVPANQDSVFTVKEVDQNNNKNIGVEPMSGQQQQKSEDNEVKNFMNEIKTLLSGLGADVKNLITSTDNIAKTLEQKGSKPKDDEDEDDAKKQFKKINDNMVAFAEVIKTIAEKFSK